jgi:hypothetical protein
MKKTFLLTLLSLLLLIAAAKLKAQSLVASYPFTGNANDASGNNNHAVVTGATLTTDRFGTVNTAYAFAGGSNVISAPDQTWLNLTTTFTVAGWISPTSTPPTINSGTAFTIASKDVSPGNNQRKWIFGLQNGALAFHINGPSLNSGEWVVSNSFTVQLNQWYYCVATKNGNTVNFYLNGANVGSATLTGTLLDPAGAPLTIGYSEPGLTTTGKLDDIKIYNGILTDAQIFDTYVNDLTKPGSGNGMQLTRTGARATDPWINVGSGYDFGNQPFTYETWVKRDDLHTTINNFSIALFLSENNNGWGIGIDNSNRLFISKVGINGIFSTGVIADLKWHHIAVAYTGTEVSFYIDGIFQDNFAYIENFNSAGNYTIGARQSFGNANGDQTLNGMIDETRIWKNIALSQTQIRDWMCKKVTSAHPAFQNLFGYFRFDEGSTNLTGGFNANFGTLLNTPTWQNSGAALGDASAHDYVNATKTASINHPTGENFTVTSTSGNPDGIQVYRVDEVPNSLTGTQGVGSNNKYFGVFQVDGTSPQYTAVYNYNGNPGVNANNENQLRLFKRTDNTVTTWSILSSLPDNPTNTITVTGESTEYILGSIGLPLPLTLISFGATKCNSGICLFWSTENEQDFSHFEIEKSNDASNFFKITTVQARNFSGANSYSSTDVAPSIGNIYYRLKQVNSDGSFTYSRIIKIALDKPKMISLQPNPAVNTILVKGIEDYQQIRIKDINGKILMQKNIKASIEEVNISPFAKGIYLLQLLNTREIKTLQFVKQ